MVAVVRLKLAGQDQFVRLLDLEHLALECSDHGLVWERVLDHRWECDRRCPLRLHRLYNLVNLRIQSKRNQQALRMLVRQRLPLMNQLKSLPSLQLANQMRLESWKLKHLHLLKILIQMWSRQKNNLWKLKNLQRKRNLKKKPIMDSD